MSGAKPVIADKRPSSEAALVYAFVLVPTLALIAAVPLAWGWGLSWLDVGLAVAFYLVSGFGVTVGFHRYFTHRAFKARKALRNGLAIAGSLAMQSDVVTWVADHRRHHAFTDKEGDPHSPWLFGRTPLALVRGFFHAHLGWMFNRDRTNIGRFAPDLQSDRAIGRIGKLFPLWTLITFLAPALIGGVATMSWWGAFTAFFWAGARTGRGAAPRDLVDQLDLPHGRRPAVGRPGPGHQRLAAGDPLDGRVLAQPAPRRPDLRPARHRARSDRHVGPRHLGA